MNNLTQNNNNDITKILFAKSPTADEISINVYPSVSDPNHSESWNLYEIIENISSSDILEEMVSQVRTAISKIEKKYLKKKIPVFRPCINNDKPTGLIQFDIDDHNIENSVQLKKILIEKIPSLLYAFISPSGGLKFAIQTDYTDSTDNFKFAYACAKEHLVAILHDAGVDDVNFDDKMSSIFYLCYMSYDPKAYLNQSPELMYISKQVKLNAIQQKEITSSNTPEPRPTFTLPTTENDKIVCLEAIDAIAEKKDDVFRDVSDRIKLANAIVNVFGHDDGLNIIMNTLQYFKGDSGYLKSLIEKENKFDIGTIIHYGKMCGFKGTTESFKQNNTAGDTERAVQIPKDISRATRYSTQESTALIEERIQQFFNERKSIQLIVEMGAGKTQIALQKAIEYMDSCEKEEKEPLKIAMFVPSHKLGEESLDKLFKFDSEIFACGGSLGPKRRHKVIGGYSKHCEKLKDIPEEERKDLIRNPWECENCEYNDHCLYIYQFFFENNLIRIYPHNYLFTPSEYDKKYKPDLVIIDEDPSGQTIIERTYDQSNGKIWKKILEEGFNAIDKSELSSANSLLKLQITAAQNKIKKEIAGSSSSSIKTLNAIYSELNDIDILMHNKGIVSEYEDKVHINYKKPIDSRWLNVPILYLNGTGNKEISDAIFGKDKFEITEEIRVQYNPNVKVYQVQNKSFSIEQMKDEDDKNKVFDLISYFYHYDNSCFVSYSFLIEEYLAKYPDCDPERFMYFGNTRGKKGFEDKNIIIVIGRHCIPHQALVTKGKLYFDCDDIDTTMEKVKRNIELNDDDYDAEIERMDFVDSSMQLMSQYYNEGEVLQAIHRLRLLHGTENKTVIYLSNFILDGLRVDKLITQDDIMLKDVRMKLVKAVQEHGVIEGKPRIIAEKSGLTPKQVSNQKDSAWFQENPFFYIDKDLRLIDRYGNQS
jgi:hypothetical protein